MLNRASTDASADGISGHISATLHGHFELLEVDSDIIGRHEDGGKTLCQPGSPDDVGQDATLGPIGNGVRDPANDVAMCNTKEVVPQSAMRNTGPVEEQPVRLSAAHPQTNSFETTVNVCKAYMMCF